MDHRIAVAAPLSDVETPRLILRRFESGDLDALAVVFAKPEVWQFPYGRGLSTAETEAFIAGQIKGWEQNEFGCWLAIEKPSRRIIGYLGLSVPTFLPEVLPAVEVGWRLDPGVWGRGYATEGGRAALQQGFERLGLSEICSIPQLGNEPSSRVCMRLGMTRQREVAIPANERRGALRAELFVMGASQWRNTLPPLPG
jgi:RimJ/RimL family protein N-acetyltransferase